MCRGKLPVSKLQKRQVRAGNRSKGEDQSNEAGSGGMLGNNLCR